MNVDSIYMTIANIEADPTRFNMFWPNTCIIGFTSPTYSHNDAQDLLGLTSLQAQELFYPMHKPLSDITPSEALHTLHLLALTGAVSWPLCRPSSYPRRPPTPEAPL